VLGFQGHRALQDIWHTIALTAAHGGTGKRLCEGGNLFGRAKKRSRSYSATVDAMQRTAAGSGPHVTKAGDSYESSGRQAGAAAAVDRYHIRVEFIRKRREACHKTKK